MKTFAWLVSMIASRMMREEWGRLRDQATMALNLHGENDAEYPSILAQELLISGEDHRFFTHGGIDLIAVCRAIWRGAAYGRWEGASTLEMQVVRVLTGRYERTLKRKIREMGLASLLCREIPKERLSAFYLQLGYFGWRMNGIASAYRRIGRPKAQSPMETARLVARLRYPQPRNASRDRYAQIDMRARHLLKLHQRHQRDQIFRGLNATSEYAPI